MRQHLHILIVDDEVRYQEVFDLILRGEGYTTRIAGTAEDALRLLDEENFDLLLTDLVLPGMDGVDLLKIVKERYTGIEVIIVTGYGTVKNAVEAMKLGAYTYFIKSHDPEELVLELKNLDRLCMLRNENRILREQQLTYRSKIRPTSRNPRFQQIIPMAERAAKSNANILLLGESGVGKEVFAQYIHDCSDRQDNCFIPINCHALPEHLIESELFGHEKGSFTGAKETRKGKIESAEASTLFLDEIGDVTQHVQVKLLRTLESRSIERIGSNKRIQVDFRLISATNRNIEEAIASGEFRDDLYYRISTITLEIPPLRDRKEDLPDLITTFITQVEREQKKHVTYVDQRVWDYLLTYDYPGNVRELKNMVERLIVLSEEGRITEAQLPCLQHRPLVGDQPSLKELRQQAERTYIAQVLEEVGGNMTRAAERLQLSRRQLFNKIQEYGLRGEK